MKKICIMMMLLWGTLIANAQQYKVYTVTGSVTADSKAVKAKQTLTDKSILSIAKGGKIILFDSKNKKLVTIKTEGKGTVSGLLKMAGNSVKELSGSYFSFITQKMTSEEKNDNTYMQSAGSAYRDADSLLMDSIIPNDSITHKKNKKLGK